MKIRKRAKLRTVTTKGFINYYRGNDIKFGRLTKVIKVMDLFGRKIATLVSREIYTIFKGEVFTEI